MGLIRIVEPHLEESPNYPELAAAVGATVPDYRGIFLRGHGSRVSTHYGTTTHSSDGLGALQGDSIRNVWGYLDFTNHLLRYSPGYSYGAAGIFYPDGKTEAKKGGIQYSAQGSWPWESWHIARVDFSRATPTSNEIRPMNVAVKYIIYAKE